MKEYQRHQDDKKRKYQEWLERTEPEREKKGQDDEKQRKEEEES